MITQEETMFKQFIIAITLLYSLTTFAQQTADKLMIFDLNLDKIPKLQGATCKWIKGSNLKPKTEKIERDGAKWLKIAFDGNKGKGRLFVYNFKLNLPEDMESKGLELTLDYPADDFRKLQVTCIFKEGKTLKATLSLKKGVNEYYFAKGFSRTGMPANWDGLKSIVFFFDAGMPEIYLKQIALRLFAKKKARALKIQKTRKTSEVLPGRGSTEIKFTADSPVSVKVGYDNQNFYIDSKAKFETAPLASFKEGDKVGSVWGDELIEYFFSGWNDNLKYIQFVCNFNGAIWDGITDYDRVAARVIRKSHDWSLKHSKKQKFENGVWENNSAFSLADLKINTAKQRFMGFQFVQNYSLKKRKHFGPVVWAECKKFPVPKNFGLLVFNKLPFGNGTIEPQDVKAIDNSDNNTVSFELTVNVQNLAPGKYKIRKYVADPHKKFFELSSETIIVKGDKTFKIKYPDCNNLNGIFTLYAALENRKSDMRMCAVNVENSTPVKDMFGEKVFCPKPKKVTWKKGVFKTAEHDIISVPANATARTMKTADIFVNKLLGFAAKKYKVIKGGNRGIVLGFSSSLKPEGYHLKITPEKVFINGADEAGLYYGCRKFLQILKQPMKRLDTAPVQCVEIFDWPDLKKRFTNLMHPWTFHGRTINEKRSIDFLINWIDRYIAGSGQNMVFVQVGHCLKYKLHTEFNGLHCFYTLDDLSKLAEFCRNNFIEFVPRWQVGGHANYSFIPAHPELREKGYKNTANVTNPKHNKIVFGCIKEVIDATKCKYVIMSGDEWWHKLKKGEKPDKLLNGKSRAQAFLDFHKQAVEFCKRNNVQLMMHEDMLNPYHNGKRYDIYKVIDRFPKEIIMLNWSGIDPDRNISYFADKGFRVWPNTTGEWFPNKTRKIIGGYGATLYNFSMSDVRNNYVLNLLRAAEFSWNAFSDKLESKKTFLSNGYLTALMEQYAQPYNAYASQEIKPINIQDSLNCDFGKQLVKLNPAKYSNIKKAVDLPSDDQNIGNIPMRISSAEKNCIRVGKGDSKKIEVAQKLSSIIFLHTVICSDAYRKIAKKAMPWRKWPYGRPVGDYYVKYTDGTKVKIPVRIRENLNFASEKPLYRCCLDTRYILPLKDASNNYIFLYQYEWVNPSPEKQIISIEMTQTIADYDFLLFAISGRKVIKK